MNIVSCKVVTIANYNKKYKTYMFVILFIHYSSCCILCLNVLYYLVITICLITLKHLPCLFLYTVFVFIYTSYNVMVVLIYICIFHYIFSVHLLYNHCILIRYSYYIIVTYVDIIVVYIFFLYLIMD